MELKQARRLERMLDPLANKNFEYLTKNYLREKLKRKIGWIIREAAQRERQFFG